MHTFKVILGGFGLLAITYAVGHSLQAKVGAVSGIFLGLWTAAVLANLSVGVWKAGYTVREELPVAAVIFSVPGALAGYLWRRARVNESNCNWAG